MGTTDQTVKPSSRGRRQMIKGVVVSDKMSKTRVIELKRAIRHGLYQKNLIRARRIFVHDEKNESKVGDVVVAISSSPISKNKNFRVLKIVERRA